FARDIIAEMNVEEDSHFRATNSKMILAHELGDRLAKIITNKEKAFYSEILGRTDIGYPNDGKAALTGFAHGMWIRGFDRIPITDENKYKPFKTSLKDYMQSLSAIWNIGMGIEII